MIKLNPEYQPLTKSYASRSELKLARRLLVVVPGPEADLTPVTGRVWEMAKDTGAQVRFIGLCNETTQEPSLRRMLVTASALVNAGNICADSEIIVGRDWVDAVKSRLQADDMVVCWSEPRTGLWSKAGNPILQADLEVPIYVISGLQPQRAAPPRWMTTAAAWIGSIAITLGFFWLQVEIDHLLKDWAAVLQILSVFVEFKLLLTWNKLL